MILINYHNGSFNIFHSRIASYDTFSIACNPLTCTKQSSLSQIAIKLKSLVVSKSLTTPFSFIFYWVENPLILN